MFSALNKSVFFAFCSIVFGMMVGNVASASGLLPLSSGASDVYPYSTVGTVVSGDGSIAAGTVVSGNVVVTSASIFFEYLERADDISFSFFSSSGQEINAVSWHLFDDYDSVARDDGVNAVDAYKRDLMVLVFEDELEVPYAKLSSTHVDADDYRMIVGLARGLYSSGHSMKDELHATAAGESILTRFGSVSGRLHHTGDIKAARGSEGSPVFAFYDDAWWVDALVVGYDYGSGGAFVIEVDSDVLDFVNQFKESSDEGLVVAVLPSDINGTADGARDLKLGYGERFTISPSADIDYHIVRVESAGDYVIESFGELDVSGYLMNDEKQTIISDFDSNGTYNYSINITLDEGLYYLRTTPNSTDDIGDYGISFMAIDDGVDFNDDGFDSDSLMTLSLGGSGNYGIKNSGEVDSFRFVVSEPGQVIIRSEGSLDLVAKLVVPNAGANVPYEDSEIESVIAVNDDFYGSGLNVLIDAFLIPGEYVLILESRNAGEFGPYQLRSNFHRVDGASVSDFQSESIANCSPYQLGEVVDGELKVDGDSVVVYSMDFDGASEVSVSVQSSEPVLVCVYNSDFEIVQGSLSSAQMDHLFEAMTVSDDRYYVLLASDQDAEYQLKAE